MNKHAVGMVKCLQGYFNYTQLTINYHVNNKYYRGYNWLNNLYVTKDKIYLSKLSNRSSLDRKEVIIELQENNIKFYKIEKNIYFKFYCKLYWIQYCSYY